MYVCLCVCVCCRCVSMKEANSLLDSYHAKEEKFRSFLKNEQDAPVSCIGMHADA